jgi:hypothetical protein
MRPTSLAALVLLAAAPAGAGEPLRIAGDALPADGVLTRQAADVMGNDEPSHTTLLVIDDPPPAAGVLDGKVEAFEIEGEGWLELAAVFADGRREVVRSLDPEDPATRLQGTAAPRPFALAVPRGADGSTPARLELAVGMLGPGVVSVSELRLAPGGDDAPAPGGPPISGKARIALAALAGLALGGALALRRGALRGVQPSAPE